MTQSISVVIPTYNGAAYIEEALSSVFSQTVQATEVIVVDDCSNDQTADLVERIAHSAPIPLRLIRQVTNSGGPAHPINVGVAAASGEFITVLDQDDVFLPNRIEEHLGVFARGPDLSIAFGCGGILDAPDAEIEPEGDNTRDLLLQISRPLAPDFSRWRRIDGGDLLWLLVWKTCFIGYPGLTFRKRDWLAKGGVDASLKIASDYDLQCWLTTRGNAGYCPEPLYRRRIHQNNATHNSLRTNLDVSNVRERFVSAHPELLAHSDLRGDLYAWFMGFGYWLREANRPWLAVRLYRSAARLFGWDHAVVVGLAKVLLMTTIYKLTRRPPQYVRMTRSSSWN